MGTTLPPLRVRRVLVVVDDGRAPRQVVPVHDFYLSSLGRSWITGLVKSVLAADGIELIPLDWGESYTI